MMARLYKTLQDHRLIVTGSLLLILITTSSCGGSLFRVKPVVELPTMPAAAKTASASGITFRVAPLLTDEESQLLFESNLPLAGILPVRVELVHESGLPIELKKARFHLRDGQGLEWKFLSAKKASARILKANGISLYNPNSRKQFEKEFTTYELDYKTPLMSSERRQGFLFFQTPNKQPVSSPAELTLMVERLPEAVAIPLW